MSALLGQGFLSVFLATAEAEKYEEASAGIQVTSDDLAQDVAMMELGSGQIVNWMWAPSGQRRSQESV